MVRVFEDDKLAELTIARKRLPRGACAAARGLVLVRCRACACPVRRKCRNTLKRRAGNRMLRAGG